MNAAALLSRLENVRRSGKGWIARCPAHADKSPSLSITEADGGVVLVHCFSGCDTADVMGSLGLELADLYPERIRDPSPEARQRAREAFKSNGWRAALGVLSRESMIVEIAAHQVGEGKPLDEHDHARLILACQRIRDTREVLV